MSTLATRVTRIVQIVLLAGALVHVWPSPAAGQTPPGTDVKYEILSEDTQDPLMIQVAPDGRVIWIEREGGLNVLLPDGTQVEAGTLPVSANACNDCVVQDPIPLEEGGLHGLLLAKDFDTSGRIYLYYSVPGTRDPQTAFGTYRLSTFVLDDSNVLQLDSEVVILENAVEWDHCCHYGGNLEWLPDGTILLSTGDDVPATSSNGYGPRDTRNSWTNGELSSANPADRRGKILRLMPDGSVPDGSQPGIAPNPFIGKSGHNPYIPDTSGDPTDGLIAYDPYVYSLGYKQPFRGAVHPPTGTFFLGDVGPDAFAPDPAKGPRGQEEINVVRPGGGVHHGWPRCIADNQPYHDYDYVTGTDKGLLDCSEMEPAVMWYPHDVSDRWPAMGAGGVTSIPAAFYGQDTTGALRLPARFNDTLLLGEFSRGMIYGLPVAADGTLNVDQSSWKVLALPNKNLIGLEALDPLAENGNMLGMLSPIDITIGPDGALYVVEYGQFFYNNGLSRVSRISCTPCSASPADYGLPAGAPVGHGGQVTKSTPNAIEPFNNAAVRSASATAPTVAMLAIGCALLVLRRRRRRTVV